VEFRLTALTKSFSCFYWA